MSGVGFGTHNPEGQWLQCFQHWLATTWLHLPVCRPATELPTGKVQVSWASSSGATSYKVYELKVAERGENLLGSRKLLSFNNQHSHDQGILIITRCEPGHRHKMQLLQHSQHRLEEALTPD